MDFREVTGLITPLIQLTGRSVSLMLMAMLPCLDDVGYVNVMGINTLYVNILGVTFYDVQPNH